MLVVKYWPSSLIMMKVVFQASTSFHSQWVPQGERRGAWYGLIVWACVQVPDMKQWTSLWWYLALCMPKPTHIAEGRYGSRGWCIARWIQIKMASLCWQSSSWQARKQAVCHVSETGLWVQPGPWSKSSYAMADASGFYIFHKWRTPLSTECGKWYALLFQEGTPEELQNMRRNLRNLFGSHNIFVLFCSLVKVQLRQ